MKDWTCPCASHPTFIHYNWSLQGYTYCLIFALKKILGTRLNLVVINTPRTPLSYITTGVYRGIHIFIYLVYFLIFELPQ